MYQKGWGATSLTGARNPIFVNFYFIEFFGNLLHVPSLGIHSELAKNSDGFYFLSKTNLCVFRIIRTIIKRKLFLINKRCYQERYLRYLVLVYYVSLAIKIMKSKALNIYLCISIFTFLAVSRSIPIL